MIAALKPGNLPNPVTKLLQQSIAVKPKPTAGKRGHCNFPHDEEIYHYSQNTARKRAADL